MDLLATVRKEGSRGGTGDFKWSDVQNSSRRENYLGHSLMAPVGRWQKGRDLSWYARSNDNEQDGEDPAEKVARERKREIQLVKQAEEDAIARALGLPVADRSNANLEPLNSRQDVDRALKDTIGDDEESGTGVGYGAMRSAANDEVLNETIEGNAESQDKELQYALKEYKRRHGDDRKRHHGHGRDDNRHGRDKTDRRHHHSRRHRSRSRDRYHRRDADSRRDRSRSPRRSQQDDGHRDRSRSPQRPRRDDRERRRSPDDHDRRRSRDYRDRRRSRDDRDRHHTRDD